MKRMWGGVLFLALLLIWSLARGQSVNGTTTGGTATTAIAQALATNSNRRGFIVQNNSTTITLYAGCGSSTSGLSTTTMHQIVPGGNWEPSVPCLDNVYVLTSTSTAPWVATDY